MQKTPEIKNAKELVQATIEANRKFPGQVWWRGHRNFSWKLSPSVTRLPHHARSEQDLISRFRHKAPSRHSRVPMGTDNAGWLFLMQHYRLPTRLLDWSESPLVAAYFASEQDPVIREHADKVQDQDGALFALSPFALNGTQFKSRILFLPDDELPLECINAAFNRNLPDAPRILAIRPSEVDSRLMVQLSVFTLHGAGMAIEDLPRYSDLVMKWVIPAASKRKIRQELRMLGTRESSLFPDLEHLAIDVASSRFKDPKKHSYELPHDPSDRDLNGESSTG
jgi:hypothetical protein